MNLDRYMDDFGHELSRAQERPRRRARLALALPAVGGLAAAAILVSTQRDGIDAVAEARAALSAPGEIVYMKVQMGRVGRFTPAPTEQWYTPGRWRLRYAIEPARGVTVTDRRGPLAGRIEFAASGDRVRFYIARRDVMTINRGVANASEMMPGLLGGDPASELREQLAKGDVRDDGVVSVDGREVRRLVRNRDSRGRVRFVYYMDPQTFAPVGGRMYLDGGGRPLEFKVSGYQRIPLNAETEKLLKIEKTPNTKFVWRDAPKPGQPARRAG